MGEQPHVLTVPEAAKRLRIGRTAAYEAARRGELPVVRIGRSLRVPRLRLEQMLRLENGDGPDERAEREITTPEGGSDDGHDRGAPRR